MFVVLSCDYDEFEIHGIFENEQDAVEAHDELDKQKNMPYGWTVDILIVPLNKFEKMGHREYFDWWNYMKEKDEQRD